MSIFKDLNDIKEFFKRDSFAISLGFQIIDAKPGYSKVSAHYDDNSLNGAGIVHGGFTFTLADFAGAVATNAYGFTTLSIDSSISYYNAPKCNNLVAVASEMQRSNRLSYITVCIHDDCGTHIADFKGTYYITKKEITIL